jgi:hypothetical protein
MRYPWGVLAAAVLLCSYPFQATGQETSEPRFLSLLNGRDLTGWVLVNTPAETWTMQDGFLVCSGKPIGELRTERMYQNFILEVEWRHMVPGGNAGIFVWADAITAPGVPFHRSIEVQVLDHAYGQSRGHTTHGDIFPIHGARMTPLNGRGGSRAFPVEERALPSPQWNHYRIECRDGEISLAVNGAVVTRGRQASPRRGYICLESEGGVVHYRKLQIMELPDTAIAAEDVAHSNRGDVSLYSGLDLRGWTLDENSQAHWNVEDWVLRFDGQTSAGVSTLQHSRKFPAPAFVLDVQPEAGFRALTFNPDSATDSLTISLDDKETATLLKAGAWSRIEYGIRDSAWTVSINGTALSKTSPASAEPHGMSFRVQGPARFANLYGRSSSALDNTNQ